MEEKLIILLCRYTLNTTELDEASSIISSGVDWYLVFQLALNNKIIGLVFYNLTRYGLLTRIKPILYQLMKYYYLCNRERNIILQAENHIILDAMRDSNILILPLKGSVLLNKVYCDLGSRACNDLDYLCKVQEVGKISSIMKSIGYTQGEYEWGTHEIKQLSRAKSTAWKVNFNTIPVFVKKIHNNPLLDIIEVDFSYALDKRKDLRAVEYIFENTNNGEIDAEDHIIYMCCHLLKEAEDEHWIANQADLQLIKFCDINETIFCVDSVPEFVLRSNLLGAQVAVYYCMYHLAKIYPSQDVYREIIEEFYKQGLSGVSTKYSKLDSSDADEIMFWNRIFAYDNSLKNDISLYYKKQHVLSE